MSERKCVDCAHWSRHTPEGGDPRPATGDCTRFPPTVFPVWAAGRVQGSLPVLAGTTSVYPSLPGTFKACNEYGPKFMA